MSENRTAKFRVAFLGRGLLGLRVLNALLDDPNVEVAVIFTCRHTPEVGLEKSAFADIARTRNIPFHSTDNINQTRWVQILASVQADLAVALLWVNTIGKEIIETTRLGFLNLHGGLLPRYRGNACANWAILNGEREQGVTVHLMDPGSLDSGPIVLQEIIPLTRDITIRSVTDEVTERGFRMILEAVELLRTGRAQRRPQAHGDTLLCYPRLPRDGEIDWKKPAEEILTLIRAAGDPYPGAYSYFADVRDHNRIKKMTVDEARVEEHAARFCAVPGHLLRLDNGARWAVVGGDGRLLTLMRIRIDGQAVLPKNYFRTVRQRFGLDTETVLQAITANKPTNLEKQANDFLAQGHVTLDDLCRLVDQVVQAAIIKLADHPGRVCANPLRNYSFQKRYYDWEQRERWFGIQVYRSFRFAAITGEPFAVGYWLFSEEDRGIRHRIYLSIKTAFAPLYAENGGRLFSEIFQGHAVYAYAPQGAATGWFADITGTDPAQASEELLQLSQRLLERFLGPQSTAQSA